ncbi:MAG: ScpA family protein [Candidatus Nanoarchaeia archaeon]
MHDRILDLLLKRDEITWQSIILDLVKSGEVDPWDIDISLLAQRYLETVRKLKEANLFLSGKVLLASAILLKIKSDKLLNQDFAALDNLLFPQTEMEELDQFDNQRQTTILEHPRLTIKTPQARKKKVSVEDLLSALEKALEVNDRRLLRQAERDRVPDNVKIPERGVDLHALIQTIFNKIKDFFKSRDKVTFRELLPSEERKDKIYTFVPLLHLANQEKVDLEQPEHFGEIYIHLMKK